MATRLQSADLKAAINKLHPLQKRTRRELCTIAAKGFIKDIVAVTPPSSAKATGSAAKKAGEAAIQGDVLKLAQPVFVEGKAARASLASAEDLLAAHTRARANSAGRVNPRNRKEKLLVLQSVVIRVIRQLQKNVGFLAAGWVASAAKYKVSIPAWIKRHGGAPGDANEVDTVSTFRITLGNNVRYADNVKDYERRVEKVVGYQANKMERQAEALLKKQHAEAGWKA